MSSVVLNDVHYERMDIMNKIKEICKIKETIEWIKNNPYTEEIIDISPVEFIEKKETIIVSEIQGDYPVDIKFTAMQKCIVTYKNKYFGIKKDIIVAGSDAIRYKYAMNSLYKGDVLADHYGVRLISVEFIGEETKIISE